MRKSVLILLNLTLILTTITFSQSVLYMPQNLKSAYTDKTRSYDGKPGENYFQNYAEYNISVKLNPETKLLSGEEKIVYKNNSPDSLDRLIFNLYPNLYKRGNMLDWSMGDIDLHDGVQIKLLMINDIAIDLLSENVADYNTTLSVNLTEKILPNSEAEIIIEWEYTMPSVINVRQGTYNETSFFVGFWYPKIAVYDDIVGWNDDVYSGQTEFYHEYADYKVEVTAPDEYIVLSSGVLQNAEEVLSKNILKKFNSAKTSSEIINVITADDRADKNITKGDEESVWKFEAQNLPDFAFCMSDTYLWDATSLEIGEKQVLINAAYFNENESFDKVAGITKSVISQLSADVIGIDYPFQQMTAFMGHYGMEFPGMVNDGDGDYASTVFVTAHEVTHSFFPFYVATNEVKYAWMDEGLVTFIPKVIEDSLIENNSAYENMVRIYNYYCGTSIDLPLMIPSSELSDGYRFHAYSKPAIAFLVLKQILGDEIFNKCLKEFIIRWNGKHPTGYDFFYTFEDVSGLQLDWFWKPWFFEFGYPDLSIYQVAKTGDNKTEIEISKIGNYPVPVELTIKYEDETEEIIERNASVWTKDAVSINIKIENTKEIKEITLGSPIIPDKNSEDNIWVNE